jgi:hypothetical protein
MKFGAYMQNKPKLFVFDTETQIIEINAMDFTDACITFKERCPEIETSDINLIEEHNCSGEAQSIH